MKNKDLYADYADCLLKQKRNRFWTIVILVGIFAAHCIMVAILSSGVLKTTISASELAWPLFGVFLYLLIVGSQDLMRIDRTIRRIEQQKKNASVATNVQKRRE